jgi:dolichol-phosphate mannosyltransferase
MAESERLTESPTSPAVLVVLCTYNELGNLPKLFDLLHQHLPEADILVVDDNSPDGTGTWVAARVKETSVKHGGSRSHLLARAGKLGLGTALRDAIGWCLARDYEFLINLDADLSHDPTTTRKMLDACMQPGIDVSVGTRYRPGGSSPGLPPHRKLISRMLNAYANWMLQLPLTDCSGSFRCYRTSKLRELDLHQLTCPGYGFLEEILVALKKKGARFVEVPITFDCRHAGKSKLSFRDAVGAIQTIHRLALKRT